MNKDKINQYLDSQIQWYENSLNVSEKIDDNCIGKDIFIATEKSAISVLKDIKAYINSGLVE